MSWESKVFYPELHPAKAYSKDRESVLPMCIPGKGEVPTTISLKNIQVLLIIWNSHHKIQGTERSFKE